MDLSSSFGKARTKIENEIEIFEFRKKLIAIESELNSSKK